MHTGLEQSGDGVREANDALFTLMASLVDVVQLGHFAVELEFLEKQFPVVAACIFEGVFCSFVAAEALDVDDEVGSV